MKMQTPFNVIRTIKNWPAYFAEYFGLIKKNHVVYVSRSGVKCKTRTKTSDRTTLNMVWVHSFYNPRGYGVGKDDVIVDIGAHIGTFSVMASNLANEGMVYAFEPEPRNFAMLKDNIRINQLKNIVPFNVAVSGRGGNQDFHVTKDNVDHSLHFKGGKKIRIRTTTLEQFIRKNKISFIDFLKMDCEGAEYEILFKCPGKTLKKIRKISMEYHDIDKKRNAVSLKRFLVGMGFDVEIVPERKMLYAKQLFGRSGVQ
jgi:FkbM family methyltransferase